MVHVCAASDRLYRNLVRCRGTHRHLLLINSTRRRIEKGRFVHFIDLRQSPPSNEQAVVLHPMLQDSSPRQSLTPARFHGMLTFHAFFSTQMDE